MTIAEIITYIKSKVYTNRVQMITGDYLQSVLSKVMEDVGELLGAKNPKLVQGENITLTDNADGSQTISSTGGTGSAKWGGITGTLSDQTDLKKALAAKQDSLSDSDKQEIADLHSDKVTSVNGKVGDVTIDEDNSYIAVMFDASVDDLRTAISAGKNVYARESSNVVSPLYPLVYYTDNGTDTFEYDFAIVTKSGVITYIEYDGLPSPISPYMDTWYKRTVTLYSQPSSGIPSTDLSEAVQTALGEAHSHDNKEVLDGITDEKVKEWDAKMDGSAEDVEDSTPTVLLPFVEYVEQSLTDDQKTQARTNIGLSNDFSDEYKEKVDTLYEDYQGMLDLL